MVVGSNVPMLLALVTLVGAALGAETLDSASKENAPTDLLMRGGLQTTDRLQTKANKPAHAFPPPWWNSPTERQCDDTASADAGSRSSGTLGTNKTGDCCANAQTCQVGTYGQQLQTRLGGQNLRYYAYSCRPGSVLYPIKKGRGPNHDQIRGMCGSIPKIGNAAKIYCTQNNKYLKYPFVNSTGRPESRCMKAGFVGNKIRMWINGKINWLVSQTECVKYVTCSSSSDESKERVCYQRKYTRCKQLCAYMRPGRISSCAGGKLTTYPNPEKRGRKDRMIGVGWSPPKPADTGHCCWDKCEVPPSVLELAHVPKTEWSMEATMLC